MGGDDSCGRTCVCGDDDVKRADECSTPSDVLICRVSRARMVNYIH